MENKRRKPAPALLLAILIIVVGIIFSLTARSSQSSAIAEASDHLTLDDIIIELHSPTPTHHALQESEFILSINANDDKTIELINPTIKLEMLHMDCGIVSSSLSSTSQATYSVSAAPLMKGTWVATASFQLEGQSDEVLQLYYRFEVL